MESFDIILTNDGSATVRSNRFEATYHSIHGAVTESKHVFIQAGLAHLLHLKKDINIFEMGFGTGLNVLLSYLFGKANGMHIDYTAIEKYPLPLKIIQLLGYSKFLQSEESEHFFLEIHKLDHIERKEKESSFNFTKSINDIQSENAIPGGQDLIFFDAFAPNTQELLWQKPVLENCFNSLNPKGILVTYCAQGQLRRDLQAVGFATERLPGPPGKREMLRATKP